jgi:transposase
MSDAADQGGLSRRPPRRQWAKELKVEIVAESYVPGASIAEVARRHGINANLLFTWRKRFGTQKTASAGHAVKMLPVAVVPDVAAPIAETFSEAAGRMEIVLAAGEHIIVGADVDAAALARVVKALSRR